MKKFLTILLALTFTFSIGISALAAPKKTYVDGTYKAAAKAFDSRGWKAQITVTIKGDKITATVFDYVNAAGQLKSKDKGYNDAMLKVNKTSPSIYSPQLGKALVAKQDPAKVDVVAGATSSSDHFKALAAAALANAKKGVKTAALVVLK